LVLLAAGLAIKLLGPSRHPSHFTLGSESEPMTNEALKNALNELADSKRKTDSLTIYGKGIVINDDFLNLLAATRCRSITLKGFNMSEETLMQLNTLLNPDKAALLRQFYYSELKSEDSQRIALDFKRIEETDPEVEQERRLRSQFGMNVEN